MRWVTTAVWESPSTVSRKTVRSDEWCSVRVRFRRWPEQHVNEEMKTSDLSPAITPRLRSLYQPTPHAKNQQKKKQKHKTQNPPKTQPQQRNSRNNAMAATSFILQAYPQGRCRRWPAHRDPAHRCQRRETRARGRSGRRGRDWSKGWLARTKAGAPTPCQRWCRPIAPRKTTSAIPSHHRTGLPRSAKPKKGERDGREGRGLVNQ